MPRPDEQRSIAQVSRMLRSIVEAETLEQFFWVGGRIDRLYKSDLGHIYFELVDERNRIKCVLWEERIGHVPFDLSNHLDVEVFGDVHFFESRAEAQINVSDIRRVDSVVDETNVIKQLPQKVYSRGRRSIRPPIFVE